MEAPQRDTYASLQPCIGRYVMQFSSMESIVTLSAAKVLKIEATLALFVLKEMFVAHKVNLLRRAAVQKYGSDRTTKLRSLLNAVGTAIEFRNELLHGSFVSDRPDPNGPVIQGRMGQRIGQLVAGMDPMTEDKINAEISALGKAMEGIWSEVDALISTETV